MTATTLLDTLEVALDLLRDYADAPLDSEAYLPSLLEQCEALVEASPDPEPVRTVHHFACTGGTLICKCLAVMPNVTVLSEIDPLSGLPVRPGTPAVFAPTDLIYGARRAVRPIDDLATAKVFNAALQALYEVTREQGLHLCLRDHAHSQFCTDALPDDRPTLDEIVSRVLPVRSVVTVRHPLESFLSLINNKWQHFKPFTLEEYAQRYIRFLDRYDGVALFRYEAFVAAPDAVLQEICAALDLPFSGGAESLHRLASLSGDSGRKSNRISARPRRLVPDDVAAQVPRSPAYAALCERLDYTP